jgi:class 3 adenylate cyclase
MIPETRYARATDGTHIAYQVHGDGPVDILAQRGWVSNLDHEWEEPILAGVYRRLGSIGRVIRVDRRGSGLSDRINPSALPTIEDRIDDIRAVMAAARSERLVLLGVGHASALHGVFAATYPERTHSLVIVSPPATVVARPPDADAALEEADARARWARRDYAAEWVAGGAPSRRSDEALVEWWRRDQALSASPEEAAALARLANETNIDDVLPAIHVPTLVLWRADSWTAPSARHLVARIPGAVARELPGNDAFLLAGDWQRAVNEIESFILGVAHSEDQPHRVLATLLFTDLVGSTELAARLGDAAWRDVVDRHHTLVRRELGRHRGREIDNAGDGFFAAFDGPGRAIRCATAIRDALDGVGLAVRIGVHAGECERVGPALRGIAVHVGARIASQAQAGEILVSSTVRDLVAGSGIGFASAGRRPLKGVDEPWHVFLVTSLNSD